MEQSRGQAFRLLAIIGPGILVAATGVGAGDLATGAFTGNKLGVAVLWAVLVGAFIKFVLNEGLARWQLVTGETLLEGTVRRIGWPVLIIFLPYLLLWSFFVGAALISACGVAMHAIVPVFDNPHHGKIVFGILHSLAGVFLVLKGGFILFRKIMLVCIGIMFLVVTSTAVLVCEDWGLVLQGLVVPMVPMIDGPGLGWTVALMGGVGGTLTVLCYGYWIKETGRSGIHFLNTCRLDLALAYGATALFGISMVIIGSSIPELPPGGGAALIVHLADLLESSTGTVGRWAFLIGAWSAIFSSLFGVWQAVPYLFADLWRIRLHMACPEMDSGKDASIVQSRPYRAYLLFMATVPMLGLVADFSQVQKIYAIFGALFMPLLAMALLFMNGKPEWMGDWRNRRVTVAIHCGTLLLFLFLGYLQVRRQLGM